MATSSSSSESDRIPASCIYRLGDAVVRFRYYAELNYAGADDTADFGGGPPVVPRVIETCFGKVLDHALRTADALPAVSDDAQALIAAARTMRDHIGQVWLDADHCRLLRDRRSAAEESDGLNNGYCDWLLLSRSPLAPPAWAEYHAAADRLEGNLPGVCGPLFRLSRLLAGISFPLRTSYDDDLGTNPVFDTDRLLTQFGPRIVELVRAARAGTRLLDGVEGHLDGRDAYASAVALHKRVCRVLSGYGGRGLGEGAAQTGSPLSTPPAGADNRLVPAEPKGASVATTDAGHKEEDVAGLLKLKRRMDPADEYVGLSLPVLRLFRRIEDLNRLPDEPVVICGPSGSGKTEIARLVHRSSGRTPDRFKHLQANDVAGGDEGIIRDKWAGRGKNAGLGRGDRDKPVPGLLQEYAGGTIFLDELHNLDRFNQEYLRKVLDRRPIPPGAGRGPDIIPDVRLIFATFHDPDELHARGVLLHDFYRRLGQRYLVVPSLNDRKEDIPLFVGKFRGDRVADPDFLFALLQHDWGLGQVGGLIRAVRTAAARTPARGKLSAADLTGDLPPDLLHRVKQTPADEIKRAVLGQMVETLSRQGFRLGSRKAPLNHHLAKLFGVSEATMSRWLESAGLDGTNPA